MLKITFYSNFLNHHQTSFCEAMVKRLGENFHYVATVPVPEERLSMGYHDYTKESYAINAYESEEQYNKALECFKKCLDNNWDLDAAVNNYVRTLLAMKRFKDAKNFAKNPPFSLILSIDTHYNV